MYRAVSVFLKLVFIMKNKAEIDIGAMRWIFISPLSWNPCVLSSNLIMRAFAAYDKREFTHVNRRDVMFSSRWMFNSFLVYRLAVLARSRIERTRWRAISRLITINYDRALNWRDTRRVLYTTLAARVAHFIAHAIFPNNTCFTCVYASGAFRKVRNTKATTSCGYIRRESHLDAKYLSISMMLQFPKYL